MTYSAAFGIASLSNILLDNRKSYLNEHRVKMAYGGEFNAISLFAVVNGETPFYRFCVTLVEVELSPMLLGTGSAALLQFLSLERGLDGLSEFLYTRFGLYPR
jgi:hypothetical protein